MRHSKWIKLTVAEYEQLRNAIKEDLLKEMIKRTLDVTMTNSVRPVLPDGPPRLDPVRETPATKMEENTSTASAIERALQRLEEQAKGL